MVQKYQGKLEKVYDNRSKYINFYSDILNEALSTEKAYLSKHTQQLFKLYKLPDAFLLP